MLIKIKKGKILGNRLKYFTFLNKKLKYFNLNVKIVDCLFSKSEYCCLYKTHLA